MHRKSKKPVKKQTQTPSCEGVVGRVGQMLLPMTGLSSTTSASTSFVVDLERTRRVKLEGK